VAEPFQALPIVAGEAVGHLATVVVRPEIMVRHTIPQDGARKFRGETLSGAAH
jgi:hypothetical protein